MEERSSHLTIVVGASTAAEELRRMLVRSNSAHAGIASHLRGLRKSIAIEQRDLTILCIALDRSTINRHGDALRRLLSDCHCFAHTIRSVGLLTELGLTREIAEIGCDVYAHDSNDAANAVRLLALRWRSQHPRRLQKTAAQRLRQRSDSDRPANAWGWEGRQVPAKFTPLLHSASRKVTADSSPSNSRFCRAQHGRGGNRSSEPPPAFD